MTKKSQIVITERHQQIATKWMKKNETIKNDIMDLSKIDIHKEIDYAADMLMKINKQELNEINNSSNTKDCSDIWKSNKKAA